MHLAVTGVMCKKNVTNLAVLEVTKQGFLLLEKAPNVTIKEIQEATEGTLIVGENVLEMRV